MFDQTQNNPYFNGMAMPGNYQYNGQQMPKIQNVLSPEEIKALQQQKDKFNLGLTEKESLQGACNHRSADGMKDALTIDPVTGLVHCSICGYQFKPIDENTSYDDIKAATDQVVDILQTIKLIYTDIPHDAAREYFQIIPLIDKIPQLFKYASKSFAKYDVNGWTYNNNNMGGIQMLQNLSNMFGGGMPQQPYPNMMGMPQQNPQMAQPGMMAGYPNPAYQQPMGMPQMAPQQNPFGFNGASQMPQQGYQPATQGFAYQPNQTSTPVNPTATPAGTAPAAPTADAKDGATVTKDVTV